MDDGIQFICTTGLKGQFRQAGTVQAAIRGDYLRTEDADNFVKNGLAWFHECAAQGIGLDDRCAEFAEISGDGAFAAAQAAGKADSQHAARSFLARSRLDIGNPSGAKARTLHRIEFSRSL
jgi:hypothetical protein